MNNSNPTTCDLVLIGGGHSHAIALKLWGMNPLPGVRVTLISDTSHTPYSGMLPGHVAGFYSFDETHIDLCRLAGFAKAQFYRDRAIGLDLKNHKVICENHPPVAFDYLSIDIGSFPSAINVPGASEYAILAKPVPQFLSAWNQLLQQVSQLPQKPYCLAIVGGGAGGVELALNMQSHLQKIIPQNNLTIHLFHRDKTLLTGQNKWVGNKLKNILYKRGVQLHLAESVSEILFSFESCYKIVCQSGLAVECDRVFWVTQASAANWIKTSELQTDERGFILVNQYLQSISHPHIFAAGDIATLQDNSRPKAGVFAVRQGKPLLENLQRIILEQKLKPYTPQKYYLSLIGTGDKSAIASWAFLGFQSSLLWQWKDHIDRKFMQKLSDLPLMTLQTVQPQTASIPNSMRCAGCGSKIGSIVLERVLSRLNFAQNEDIMIGLNNPDDAAVIKVPDDKLLVQTVDFFRSLINDPFVFGQVATNHCLSDIFAMGATPQSALAMASIPYALDKKMEETLYQLLSGAIKILNQSQTSLIGGHTTEGQELTFGLSCNGLISPGKLLPKKGMIPGDVLILTKAIGTGTLFAADMRYQAKGRWIDNAVESMLLSNQKASEILLECGATACTDITGFGLIGHLVEMIKSSSVEIFLDLDNIPILTGAKETIQQGFISSLHPQNLQAASYIRSSDRFFNSPQYSLLFDPQTSGGLLASIPQAKASECLEKLRNAGYKESNIIGKVTVLKEANSTNIVIV